MQDYFRTTRAPWHSFLFVLPLLLLYHLLVVLSNLGQRHAVINGADALVQNALNFVGVHGWLGSWLFLALVAGVLCYRADAAHREKGLRREYFPLLLLESALYALLFGSVVGLLTAFVLPGIGGFLQMGGGRMDFGQKLAASLGAGLYEELVFRLVLTGGLIGLLHRFGVKPGAAAAVAVVASSFVFSLFHYVGPYGEPFQIVSFTFRMIAGAVLALIFFLRGFAVAAWTHALYDVFLVFAGAA
jgi:hypothetical protein